MDQFAQTNDLQQAIDNVANGGNTTNSDNAQFGIPPMPPADNNASPIDPMFTAAPAPEMPKVEPLVSEEPAAPSAEQILSESIAPAPAAESAPVEETQPASPEVAPVVETEAAPAEDLSSVKQNILRDLLPLLDKTDKTAEEKFEIYKDAIATMHDVKTIEGAYKAASGITDEAKKADALFELMRAIDA